MQGAAEAEPGIKPGGTEILYHPLFSSDDANVVLASRDGSMHFRVHSFTLKTTSSWFCAMFTLPQNDTKAPTADVIYLDEDTDTLEGLLRMVCGLSIPQLDSYDAIEPLLYAAEKYDMSGPISTIRALVMTPALLNEPLRLYAVACRYGWQEEAKLASTQTLALNIHDVQYRPCLQKLDTDALLNLFHLHHDRRERLARRLEETPFVNGHGPAACACRCPVEYHTWRELKYAIILEMDVRPLGDTICDSGLLDKPVAQACWDARCSNVACGRVLYDKGQTVRAIRQCIDELPATI